MEQWSHCKRHRRWGHDLPTRGTRGSRRAVGSASIRRGQQGRARLETALRFRLGLHKRCSTRRDQPKQRARPQRGAGQPRLISGPPGGGDSLDDMSTLVVLRHGQSTWNAENRFTGWTDVDLSAAGEAEARSAGKLLAGESDLCLDIVHTSVLTRAVRTANLALE